MASEKLNLNFDGHRLAYRVSGDGSALVLPNLYRRGVDMAQARLLSDRWRVFQIFPLGYGYSAHVPGYSGERLSDQVLAVLDRHHVDRFVVWGYSAAGAMSLCIARATPRVAGLVCGGFPPAAPRPAVLRQLDRRLRADHPSRSLWWWMKEFDWSEEVRVMSCARLFYWGSEDRQMAKPLRQARDQLPFMDADFIEFPGVDHGGFQLVERPVVSTVAEWISQRLGPAW